MNQQANTTRPRNNDHQEQKLHLAVQLPRTYGGSGYLVNAERAPGKPFPIQEDVEGDDGEAERHENEDVVPETIEHHADDDGHQARQSHADGQDGEERPRKNRQGFGAQLLISRDPKSESPSYRRRSRRIRRAPPKAGLYTPPADSGSPPVWPRSLRRCRGLWQSRRPATIMKPAAATMTNRFAHSSKLLLEVCQELG